MEELFAFEAKMRVIVEGRVELKPPHAGKGDFYGT
jgi:hypothetical protein